MLYNIRMETKPLTKTQPGPISKGYKASSIQLPPDLLNWAKSQPEGLSGLVRHLLTAERQRRARRHAAP